MEWQSILHFRLRGSPGGSVVKNTPANARDTGDMGFIPGLERSLGGGNGNLPVFLPGKSQGQRSLAGFSPWSHRVRHDWTHMQAMYMIHNRASWNGTFRGKLNNHLSEFLDGIYSWDTQSHSESRGGTRTTIETVNGLYYTNLNAWDGGLCALLYPQEILTRPRFGRR